MCSARHQRASNLYGHERLAALAGPWYIGDALGSVRQLSRDSGALVRTTSYDPWGTIQGPDSPGIFGFTGEFQDQGLVHLRARWYAPGHGTFTSRDPFPGWPEHPASLHPYVYAGNNPVFYTDPTGQCYPPLGWLRDIEPTNCHNLDMAIKIAAHPNVSPSEYALATGYISAFVGSHSILVVGAGILSWQAIVAGSGVVTAVSQWGAAYVVAHPTAATVAGVGTAAATLADDAVILTAALAGDPYSANEIHTAQQLGAADGFSPFGDLAACGVLLSSRKAPLYVMPDGTILHTLRSSPDNYYSYRELHDLIGLAGLSEGLDAHHLLEKRFASRLGVSTDDIIAVPVTPLWHRNLGRAGGTNINDMINRELRNMSTTGATATLDQIWQAHRNVYIRLGYQEWADAIYIAYFRSKGVRY